MGKSLMSLSLLSFYSTFLPALLGMIRFRRQPHDLKLLTAFFCFTLSIEIIMFFLFTYKMNTIWLINIFSFIEGSFLIYVLSLWAPTKKVRKIILAGGLVYIVFWLATTFMMSSLLVFNDYEKVIRGIILILSTCHILINYGMQKTTDIYREYKFWMLSGMLFYFTLTLVVFGTSKIILVNDQEILNLTWPIHSAVTLCANIIFTIGYICFLQRTRSFS